MRPGARRARRPATALRSPRGQRRVLAPHTQTRITRPQGMQSDHAAILTRTADASTRETTACGSRPRATTSPLRRDRRGRARQARDSAELPQGCRRRRTRPGRDGNTEFAAAAAPSGLAQWSSTESSSTAPAMQPAPRLTALHGGSRRLTRPRRSRPPAPAPARCSATPGRGPGGRRPDLLSSDVLCDRAAPAGTVNFPRRWPCADAPTHGTSQIAGA